MNTKPTSWPVQRFKPSSHRRMFPQRRPADKTNHRTIPKAHGKRYIIGKFRGGAGTDSVGHLRLKLTVGQALPSSRVWQPTKQHGWSSFLLNLSAASRCCRLISTLFCRPLASVGRHPIRFALALPFPSHRCLDLQHFQFTCTLSPLTDHPASTANTTLLFFFTAQPLPPISSSNFPGLIPRWNRHRHEQPTSSSQHPAQ